MAVDLEDLVPALRVELGTTTDSTTALVTRLSNAFWEARLNGLFTDYREEDGLIVPISGTEDLGRDYQQLLVLYAAYAAMLTDFRNAQSQFSAKAGPVEYSTQRSVGVMKELLTAMRIRLQMVVDLIAADSASTAYIVDAMIARTEAMAGGDAWWVRG